MSIARKLMVPTGEILIINASKGQLECLSLGDYGRNKNVKADFLGLRDDINGVPNGDIMPLSEKWVVTISTQYGCSMKCKFCDVPKVGSGKNATKRDLTKQVLSALAVHPEVGATKHLNVHYARMGEPTFNGNVLAHAKGLRAEVMPFVGRSHVHPVVSTMMPRRNKNLIHFLQDWCEIKNYNYCGAAGLQLSINSTSDSQRFEMFNGNSLSLGDISKICKYLPDPVGRKYALNIAMTDETELDAGRLASLFSPKKFMVKITPMHATGACVENAIETTDGYTSFAPYQKIERSLKDYGRRRGDQFDQRLAMKNQYQVKSSRRARRTRANRRKRRARKMTDQSRVELAALVAGDPRFMRLPLSTY